MEHAYLRAIYWRLTGIVMAATLISLVAVSYFAHQAFERALAPEMASKAVSVGASVRSLIVKALGYGIEYQALHGVEQSFAEMKSENPDFSYMVATDERGAILSQSGTVPEGVRAHFMAPELLNA